METRTINFKKDKKQPLYEQVYQKLQEDMMSGYLKKGDQLPSIRSAVDLFHVSKTSIERAYEQLLLDGWIVAVAQKGYFVDVDTIHVNMRKEIIQASSFVERDVVRYDFRSQSMDMDAFDLNLWKKYIKDVLDHHQEIATYGDAQGEKSLRRAFCDYAYAMRGVLSRDEQLLIGSSFQSLLYMLCGLFPHPLIFGMEDHEFIPFQTVCEDYKIPLRTLPMDAEGILIEPLYESDINLLYLNSVSCGSHHQPISSSRRSELLEWAKVRGAWIIEDDHNGELRYQSRMTPAMQGFDDGSHVIYIGSFSKLLLPSLRISYMVLPYPLQERFMRRVNSYSPTASKIEQLALAQYIIDGHLHRHVKRLSKRYARKSQRMKKLLVHAFPQADIYLEESALQFIVRMHQPYDETCLLKLCKEHKIRITIADTRELVLSFAAISEEDMEEAIQELHTIFLSSITIKKSEESDI